MYHLKQELWLVGDFLVAIARPFFLPSTWVGRLNTGTFWGAKSYKRMSDTEYCSINIEKKSKRNLKPSSSQVQQRNACVWILESMLHLKSECVMAWEESFSKIRVTGRCNGWFGASNMLWQWARSVDTSPPSHIIWRFRSDLTMAWMWCASENWTSIESCKRGNYIYLYSCVLNSMQH